LPETYDVAIAQAGPAPRTDEPAKQEFLGSLTRDLPALTGALRGGKVEPDALVARFEPSPRDRFLQAALLAELATFSVILVLNVVGFGEKDAVTPAGRPVTDILTLPLNPY